MIRDVLVIKPDGTQEKGTVELPDDFFATTEDVPTADDLISIAQLRYAIQKFALSLTEEDQLEIPYVFPSYRVGQAYKIKDVFSHGVNGVGDPQLYQVLQDHTSAAEWAPDAAVSLYKAVGVTADGYPEWSQPVGASDAYNTGDIVSFNGTLYRSTIDANVWSPTAYPAGWEVYAP
jgi:hypothetical protein